MFRCNFSWGFQLTNWGHTVCFNSRITHTDWGHLISTDQRRHWKWIYSCFGASQTNLHTHTRTPTQHVTSLYEKLSPDAWAKSYWKHLKCDKVEDAEISWTEMTNKQLLVCANEARSMLKTRSSANTEHTVSWNRVKCCTNVRRIAFEKACNRWMTCKVIWGHCSCCHLICHVWFPISLPF